jgi:cyanate permease
LSQNEDQDGNNTTTKVGHNEEEEAHQRVVETFHGSVYSLNEFEPKFYERYTCLRLIVGILKEMSDFKLLRENFGFLIMTMSNFFLFTGYFTPFLYIIKIAEVNGIEKAEATFLISVIGIVNIPARMIYGFIADRRYVSPINLNTFSVIVATIPLFLYSQLQKHYWSQMLFSIFFAIGMGTR